jgi:hypothetical protein
MGHMIRRQYSFLTAAAIFGLLICVGCQGALAAELSLLNIRFDLGIRLAAKIANDDCLSTA